MQLTYQKKAYEMKEISARVSDFSHVEIPSYRLEAVTNIWCTVSDHGYKGGNKSTVFDLELTTEEMTDFRRDLALLVQKHMDKHMDTRVKIDAIRRAEGRQG